MLFKMGKGSYNSLAAQVPKRRSQPEFREKRFSFVDCSSLPIRLAAVGTVPSECQTTGDVQIDVFAQR